MIWALAAYITTKKNMNSKSKECSCHTHPVYLTYQVTQLQNLPLGHKKKTILHRPLPNFLSVFFFPCFFSPSGFVLQRYLSTEAVWWSRATVNIFLIVKVPPILDMSLLAVTLCIHTCVHSQQPHLHREGTV